MGAAKFVESYFDAWNHRDPEAIAGHLAADGIHCDVPENMQRTQKELVITLNDFFSNYRYRYELIGDVLNGRNTLAFQYRMCPTKGGNGTNEFFGAEFITLTGDAALSITDYYDIPGIVSPSHLAGLTTHDSEKPKYAKSGLDEEKLHEYKARLETIMRSKQAYLRSGLTLPKLAMAVDCSVNHLSQVINSGFGMSFFDYLNQYRIEHAKGLLTGANRQSDDVLNVAFTVGFNSNSAFYAAFKKYVGQTPAQFRRSHQNQPH